MRSARSFITWAGRAVALSALFITASTFIVSAADNAARMRGNLSFDLDAVGNPTGIVFSNGDTLTAAPKDGRTILNGSGPPALLTAQPGDFYIDTAAHMLYGPYIGSWPEGVALIGPPGPGATGVRWRGTFDPAGPAYEINDLTECDGSTFIVVGSIPNLCDIPGTCTQPETQRWTRPGTPDEKNWRLFAARGLPGPTGNDSTVPGPQGPSGTGVPTGGTSGQVLQKNSNADFDSSWGTLNFGDVLGPAITTDNTIAVFDGVSGKAIKPAGDTINVGGAWKGSIQFGPQSVTTGPATVQAKLEGNLLLYLSENIDGDWQLINPADTGNLLGLENNYDDGSGENKAEYYQQYQWGSGIPNKTYARTFMSQFNKVQHRVEGTFVSGGVTNGLDLNINDSTGTDDEKIAGKTKLQVRQDYIKSLVPFRTGDSLSVWKNFRVNDQKYDTTGILEATYGGNIVIESGDNSNSENGVEFISSNTGVGFRQATVFDGVGDIDLSFQSRYASQEWIPRLSLKASNGYLGIGTDSPSAPLDVVGSIKASGNITGANLTGINTGDQDLSGLVPKTTTVNGQPLTGNITISSISGNADTATALAANGANCSSGQAAGGINAFGTAEDCTTYVTPTGIHTEINKTLNDDSNYIDANALHERIFNNSGDPLAIGQCVRNTHWNAVWNAVEVIKAQADSPVNARCHGLIEALADNGAVGFMRTSGRLENVDTSAWSDGDDLWLSPDVAGGLTNIEPTANGQYKQLLGTVLKQSASSGIINIQISPPVLVNNNPVVTSSNPVKMEQEFLHASFSPPASWQPPWTIGPISGGASTMRTGSGLHPGIVGFISTASNSGGYAATESLDSLLLAGGEESELVFRIPTATDTTIRFGFLDSLPPSQPTDGCWLESAGTAVSGFCKNSAGQSKTSTEYALESNTWYRGRIAVNTTASSVLFELFSENNTLLWSNTVATNIPTTSGSETGHGVVASNSGPTEASVLDIDYMSLVINRKIVR